MPAPPLPHSLQTTQARHSDVHTHQLCLRHQHTLLRTQPGGADGHARLGARPRTRYTQTHAFTRAPTSHAHTRPLSPCGAWGARRAGTRTALGPSAGDGPAARPPPLPRPRAHPAGSRPQATHRRGGRRAGRQRQARVVGPTGVGGAAATRSPARCSAAACAGRARARSRPSPPRGRAAPCARARAPRRLGGRRGCRLPTLNPSTLPRTLEGRGLAQPRRPSPFQRQRH